MMRTYASLDRTELIVCILSSIVRLKDIWSTWSFMLRSSIVSNRVRLPIQDHRWLLFKNLLKVYSICCDSLFLLYLGVIKFYKVLKLAYNVGSIVGVLTAGVWRKPQHF